MESAVLVHYAEEEGSPTLAGLLAELLLYAELPPAEG